jgi:hypothetical protein
MQLSRGRCDRRRTPVTLGDEAKAAMVQRRKFDPKVSCPACAAPVSTRTGIVELGACSALLCPHCGELSFPQASNRPGPFRLTPKS